MFEKLFSALPRISNAVFFAPWGILPAFHRESIVPQLLEARGNMASFSRPRGEADGMSEEEAARLREARLNATLCAAKGDWLINKDNRRAQIGYNIDSASRIGQINVSGIIGKGLDSFDMMCGGVCVDQIQNAMEHLAEFSPRALAMHFNTPGGVVTGVPECADFITAWSRAVAPVHAFTDTMCASCGYYLASAADSFTAAASATIGSIGVYCAALDSSAAYEQRGLKMHLMASGWAKGQGMSGTPVSQDYLAFLQAGVDRAAARFYAHVTTRRMAQIEAEAAALTAASGTAVEPAAWASAIMQGQYWDAQDAPRSLFDGILPTRRAHLAGLQRALTSGK